MPTLRNRAVARRFAVAFAAVVLACAGSAQLLPAAFAAAQAAGTQTVPVPASAKAQNGLDASSNATPSNPGGTGAPAAGAATPTTTYAPSGGTAQPATTTPAVASPTTAVTTPTATVPAVSSATAVITHTPAPATAKKGDRGLSTGAILIAVLAALLILACAAWALARQRAFEPHWLLSLRHAMAEAGFRASATWSEFTDWARLGH